MVLGVGLQSNDVKEELFLEHVLDECLATGYASELLDAIRAVGEAGEERESE